jgi:hypothetical protein
MKWHRWIVTAKKRILMEMDTSEAWPTELTLPPSRSRETDTMAWPPVADCSSRSDGNSQGTHISSLTGNTTREIHEDEEAVFLTKGYNLEDEPIMDIFDDNYGNTENDLGFEMQEGMNLKSVAPPTTRLGTYSESEQSAERRPIIDFVEDLNEVRRYNTGADVLQAEKEEDTRVTGKERRLTIYCSTIPYRRSS